MDARESQREHTLSLDVEPGRPVLALPGATIRQTCAETAAWIRDHRQLVARTGHRVPADAFLARLRQHRLVDELLLTEAAGI